MGRVPFIFLIGWQQTKIRGFLRKKHRDRRSTVAHRYLTTFFQIMALQIVLYVSVIMTIFRFGEDAWGSVFNAYHVLTAMPWFFVMTIMITETQGVTMRRILTLKLSRLEAGALLCVSVWLTTVFAQYLIYASADSADLCGNQSFAAAPFLGN